jgi:hypothetical protein
MKTQEKEYLAAAYAAAWNAVKGDSMVVSVLDNGWFLCLYGRGIPSSKCRAEKLLKGLAVLTGRLETDPQCHVVAAAKTRGFNAGMDFLIKENAK